MKQTTLTTCPKLTHSENACIPYCEDMNTEVCHKYPGDKTTLNPMEIFHRVEDLPCPVCGVPRINPVYCLNCGEVFDKHLLRLEAARVASLEDES